MHKPRPVWAAFDFDGTLTRRDTLLPFLAQVLGTRRLAVMLALELPWLAAYATGLFPTDRATVRLLQRALGGMRGDFLEQQGRLFAAHGVPPPVRNSMLQRLREHQQKGHYCVLVTASLTIYTRPWAEELGFQHVLGSELQFDQAGCATGMLVEGNCYGPEKERRLRAILPADARLYAYGDSRGDQEMLAMADRAWLLRG